MLYIYIDFCKRGTNRYILKKKYLMRYKVQKLGMIENPEFRKSFKVKAILMM